MSRHKKFQLQLKRILFFSTALLISGSIYCYRTIYLPRHFYQEALETAPTNPIRSERLVGQAIELSGGNYPKAELLRVQLLGKLGYWTEALGGFSLIDNFDNVEINELIAVGDLAAQAQATHLARNCYLAALGKDTTSTNVLRQLVRLELSVNNEDRAYNYCKEILAIDEEDATAWHIQGVIELNQMEPESAITSLRRALAHGAQPHAPIREDLVQALIDLGRYPEARLQLEDLKNRGEYSARAQLQDAYLLRLEGEAEQAMNIVQNILRAKKGDLISAKQLAGFLSFDAGQTKQAIDFFKEVLNAQPFNKEVHFKIAAAYQRLEMPDAAAEHSQKSRRLTDQAIELQKVLEILKLNPKDNHSRERAIGLYRKLGKDAQADRLDYSRKFD